MIVSVTSNLQTAVMLSLTDSSLETSGGLYVYVCVCMYVHACVYLESQDYWGDRMVPFAT